MGLAHDLIRGLKDGLPFWLMEQTPSMTASRDVNPLRRPGVLRLWSWQAVAHGADAVLFFQMRASRGACEKYHGAVIGHAGRSDTRVFGEVASLGAELERLGGVSLGARTPARVALLWDWDSWWALDAREADVVNPVSLGGTGFPARLVFELVIPQGAETVGTYQADFYAGTPAVTRNAFGAGHGWYVATDLAPEGVAWVIRHVVASHGLLGPYAEVPGLESGIRITPSGVRLRFLLNHNTTSVTVPATGTDLLSGARADPATPVTLPPYGVMVLREE